MNNNIIAKIIGCILLLVLIIALTLPSCQKGDLSPMSTGKVVSAQELRDVMGTAFAGDTNYAVVSYEQLPAMWKTFQGEIFKKGVTRWNERFDCNHFAAYFISLCQVRYYLDNFHSGTKSQTLAMGEIWYSTGPLAGHAVAGVLTDRGPVILETQTGEIKPYNVSNVLLRKF